MPSFPPAETHCQVTCKTEKNWWDKLKPFVEILGIALLAAYTTYTVKMYRVNKTAADAAQQSANAAADSVRATREATHADQRAWVGLASPVLVGIQSIAPHKLRASIVVHIKNFGKGPAFKAMIDARMAVAPNVDSQVQSSCNLVFPFVGLKPTWPGGVSDPNSLKRQWGQIIFPNGEFTQGANYGDDVIDAADKVVYVIGCIVYQDQFTDPHWTKFCYETNWLVRDAASFNNLAVCNTNNYTDEIEKKVENK